jgi:hypothetical protein
MFYLGHIIVSKMAIARAGPSGTPIQSYGTEIKPWRSAA